MILVLYERYHQCWGGHNRTTMLVDSTLCIKLWQIAIKVDGSCVHSCQRFVHCRYFQALRATVLRNIEGRLGCSDAA